MKYKDGDSIVNYLKDYQRVESTIENLWQTSVKNSGELYSLGTKKLIYQSSSTGLWKDTCQSYILKNRCVQKLKHFIIIKLNNIIIMINQAEGKKQKQLNTKTGMV